MTVRGASNRATAAGHRAIAPVRSRVDRIVDDVRPLIDRFLEVGSIQSAIVLAAQALMAVFPLLIGVVAYAPPHIGATITTFMRDRMGLSATSNQVHALVASRAQLQSGLSIFGLILVLGSATSFTRQLQRVYERAWQLPPGGRRSSLRGLLWLIGLVIYLVTLAIGYQLTTSHAVGVSFARLLVTVAAAWGLWWVTPFLLLRGRVRWRALVFSGVLTGTALVITGKASTIVMPRLVAKNERSYGTIGAIFTIQSWLVVMACVIIITVILGAVATESDGWIGRWARGSSDRDSWHRVPTGLLFGDRERRSKTGVPAGDTQPEK
jgi:membrane protein